MPQNLSTSHVTLVISHTLNLKEQIWSSSCHTENWNHRRVHGALVEDLRNPFEANDQVHRLLWLASLPLSAQCYFQLPCSQQCLQNRRLVPSILLWLCPAHPFLQCVGQCGGLNVRHGPGDPEILSMPTLYYAKLLHCIGEVTYFSAPHSFSSCEM